MGKLPVKDLKSGDILDVAACWLLDDHTTFIALSSWFTEALELIVNVLENAANPILNPMIAINKAESLFLYFSYIHSLF